MDAVVKFDDVKKVYSKYIKALNGVSFEIPAESIFALLGPKGAGKTTILKIIIGLINQTEGNVSVMGVKPFPNGNKDISFVPEEKNLYDWMKVFQMKNYFSKFAPNFSQNRFDEISKRLDLTYKRRVKALSQGNRTKLSLALALSQDVKLYVLDEPTRGLDPAARASALNLVKGIVKEGKTVIYSSYILSEVEGVCDHLLILNGGNVVYIGTMEELKKDNEKNFFQTFLDQERERQDYERQKRERQEREWQDYERQRREWQDYERQGRERQDSERMKGEQQERERQERERQERERQNYER